MIELTRRKTPRLYDWIKGLENLGVRWKLFGSIYNRIFYMPLLSRELHQARIEVGMKIIHVGCGSLPLTALFLGQKGYQVVAVDNDARAIEKAREVIKDFSLEKRITLLQEDGRNLDYSPYDVVWISLHATPRDEILNRALKALRVGGKLICRNSRGWLKPFCSPVESNQLPSAISMVKKKEMLGKETLIIQKTHPNSLSLKHLHPGMTGKIASLPEEPLLAPLGFRQGKRVTLKSREPFQGPFIAEVEGRRIALGEELAQKIMVESG